VNWAAATELTVASSASEARERRIMGCEIRDVGCEIFRSGAGGRRPVGIIYKDGAMDGDYPD